LAKGHPLKTLSVLLGLWVGSRFATHVYQNVTPTNVAPTKSTVLARSSRDQHHQTYGTVKALNAIENINAETQPIRNLARPKIRSADLKAFPPSNPSFIEKRTKAISQRLPPLQTLPLVASVQAVLPIPIATDFRPLSGVKTQGSQTVPFSRTAPITTTLTTIQKHKSGLFASAWLMYRPDVVSTSEAPAGQLGGSQIGMRMTLPIKSIGQAKHLSLYVRASAPLETRREREAAIGASVKAKILLPIEIGIERRVALSQGGRDAWGVLGSTGLHQLPLGSKLHLSGYGQAGVVGTQQRDGFVDGSVEVASRIRANADVGLAIWGAAQRQVSRLDIGPVANIKFRIADQPMRLSLQWRQRISGKAVPRSGPAINLGADF
jgi:hypothetical protein